jgi:hypothetical protein
MRFDCQASRSGGAGVPFACSSVQLRCTRWSSAAASCDVPCALTSPGPAAIGGIRVDGRDSSSSDKKSVLVTRIRSEMQREAVWLPPVERLDLSVGPCEYPKRPFRTASTTPAEAACDPGLVIRELEAVPQRWAVCRHLALAAHPAATGTATFTRADCAVEDALVGWWWAVTIWLRCRRCVDPFGSRAVELELRISSAA